MPCPLHFQHLSIFPIQVLAREASHHLPTGVPTTWTLELTPTRVLRAVVFLPDPLSSEWEYH